MLYCFFGRRISAIGLVATLAACGTSGGLTGSGSGSGGSASGTSTSIPTDPKEAILQGYRQMKSRSYRLRETTTMSGPGGSNTFSRVSEFVPPDRSHGITEGYESISIGDDHYEKVDGKWLRTSSVGTRNVSKFAGANPYSKAIEAGTMVVTYIGSDQVDGKPARVYQIAGSMKFGETDIKGQQKIWLSAGEGLPLKSEGKSEPPYVFESVLTYEYDPSIRIEAPIP